MYDPCEPASLDMLAGIKSDIDKNKDKKDVTYLDIGHGANHFESDVINGCMVFLAGLRNCYCEYACEEQSNDIKFKRDWSDRIDKSCQ